MQHGPRRWLALLAAILPLLLPRLANSAEPTVPTPTAQSKHLLKEELTFPLADRTIQTVATTKHLGNADFTIGLSFETEPTGRHDLGDLMCLWNPDTRHGFTLGIRNNTGSTTSQANWRQLQFGIDAATEPQWRDEGRPGDAILGFALAVHRGQLYVGTCEGGDKQVGLVYRYLSPGHWQPLKPLDGANSVTALATYEGRLYAGTGKYRLAGSSLPESTNSTTGGKIYRLSNNDDWELVGDLAPTEAIAGLVNYGGKLYASSLYKPAGFYRYDSDQKWTSIPTPDARRVESLGVHGGALYAGSYDSGSVYRFDGTTWKDLGLVASDITQTYSFTTYQNALHVSTWPAGKVLRLDAGDKWTDCGRLGTEQEVMGMLVHNGTFYAGTLPAGEVYRYAGGTSWQLLKQLDTTPNVRFRRVWTMATFQGRLFATTLPSGHIWSMSAGSLATHDHELGDGWHDIVAQRKEGRLRLFVDGKLVAEADAASFDLKTAGHSMTIGEGPRGQFHGRIRNVWYDGPLE
ncbi:MAG TPA: hypothetical protein VM452_01510 [Caulifigura sp.]|nr:hypothetical protein [Caulifigura sp.]